MAANLAAAVIGGLIAVAGVFAGQWYTDLREARRLRAVLAAELRAINSIMFGDVLESQRNVVRLLTYGERTVLPVEFRTTYNDVFKGSVGKLGLLAARLAERIVAVHYDVQEIIASFEMIYRNPESNALRWTSIRRFFD